MRQTAMVADGAADGGGDAGLAGGVVRAGLAGGESGEAMEGIGGGVENEVDGWSLDGGHDAAS